MNNSTDNNWYISTYKRSAAFVAEGSSVDIYVASRAINIGSVVEEKPIYLCSVEAGTRLPGLNFKDKENIYWYFMFKCASDDGRLTEIPELSEAEKLSFLERTPAAPFSDDESIDPNNVFCESIMAWYQIELIRAYNDADAGESAAEEEDAAEESIMLDCLSEIYTDNGEWGYEVTEGSVNVFVGTSYSTERRKLLCLCTLEKGACIPPFGMRGLDGVRWFFRISPAKSSACLRRVPAGMAVRYAISFSVAAGLDLTCGSFEDSIVDWYNTKLIKPIIISTAEQRADEEISLDKHYISGSDPLFKAVSYACYHCRIEHHSEEYTKLHCKDRDMTVERIAEASHFICRRIVLEYGWWKSDCGPIIGKLNGAPIACVPKGGGKYTVYYEDVGTRTAVEQVLTPELAKQIDPNAYSISRTLPAHRLSKKDIVDFCLKSVTKGDVYLVGLLGAFAALIGILLPILNRKIYDDYIPLGSYSQIIQICVVIASFMAGNLFFGVVKNISEYRINSRVGYDLQNATMYRSFFLPEKFFREHESADLSQRILQIDEIIDAYAKAFIISGFGLIFAVVYLIQMFKYSAKLCWAFMAMLAVYAAMLYFISVSATKREKTIVAANGEASSKLYQFLRAIEKIRMAGAEEQAIQKYIVHIRDREAATIQKQKLLSFGLCLKGVAVTLFSMVLYYLMVKKKISLSIGNFTAFNSALGSFSSAVLNLVDSFADLKKMKPAMDRLMPIYETEPEYAADQGIALQPISALSGHIKIEDLCFAYSEGGPQVLKNLNMEINAGDYVAIVGKSGSGKSTLFKLLLGFDKPTGGRILIDGKNLNEIDKRGYRRKLGVVLQNGKLIDGSIQENITITAPDAKLADVRQVIKDVGLEDDVNKMPMGINTMLSGEASTISGGQQQRILIARALIGKPSVIMLDEATSALDNITQRMVYETIDKIKATKIVIAHRLSTIQSCNKIYVLDNGKIVETGSYEELMKNKGLFFEMASRQLVDGVSEND